MLVRKQNIFKARLSVKKKIKLIEITIQITLRIAKMYYKAEICNMYLFKYANEVV